MQIIFTVLRYLTTKQNSEQRLNGMVTTDILNFWIFHFVLIWYDKEWQLISKKYDFTLGRSFSLQAFDFKAWKIETISHQIYWDNQPSLPLFDQCWWVYKLHQDIAADKLLTNYNDIGEEEGVLRELSSGFLREIPNKFYLIELSQNLFDWL